MAILHGKTVIFNSKMTISNIDRNLSNDSRLFLVKEFMDSLHFLNLSKLIPFMFLSEETAVLRKLSRYFRFPMTFSAKPFLR